MRGHGDEAALEAGARAFYEALREKGKLRWETISEPMRAEFRLLVRPAVKAALAQDRAARFSGDQSTA